MLVVSEKRAELTKRRYYLCTYKKHDHMGDIQNNVDNSKILSLKSGLFKAIQNFLETAYQSFLNKLLIMNNNNNK